MKDGKKMFESLDNFIERIGKANVKQVAIASEKLISNKLLLHRKS